MTWSIVAAAAPPLPVKYSGDKHYLIDQNGAPFPILGRTSWFVVSLTTTDYRIYLDDTAARDYNSIEFHIISHDPRGGHPPFDGNGNRTLFLRELAARRETACSRNGNINSEAPDFDHSE